MMSQLSANQKGMILALSGYSAFAISDTAVKWIAPHYPVFQVMAIQTALSSLALLFLARFLGGWRGAATVGERRFHILRAVLNVLLSMLVFYSFTIMSLASVYAMIFAKPILATLIAIVFYHEIVNARRWSAILVGFIGVLVVLQPAPDTFRTELLIPLLASLFAAILFTSARSIKTASPFIMAFYPVLGTCLITLPFALYFGTPDITLLLSRAELEFLPSQPIAPEHIPFFFVTALFSGAGILCVSLAFRMAAAASVAPFLYIEMVWGLVLGLLIFGDIPDLWMLIGTAIIIASGCYLIRQDKQAPAAAQGDPPPLEIHPPRA